VSLCTKYINVMRGRHESREALANRNALGYIITPEDNLVLSLRQKGHVQLKCEAKKPKQRVENKSLKVNVQPFKTSAQTVCPLAQFMREDLDEQPVIKEFQQCSYSSDKNRIVKCCF